MDFLRYYTLNQDKKAKLIVLSGEDIKEYLADQNKKQDLAQFIYERLFYRYVNPHTYISKETVLKENDDKNEYDEYSLLYKNGFAIMASACLLIESLESFYKGWTKTNGPNEIAFLKFFGRDPFFKDFATNDMATTFYKSIRCGILHQGETNSGWKITRNSSKVLDINNKSINATKFLNQLEKSLSFYKDELIKAKWNDKIWVNARKKIKYIINSEE